jgi:hypothetical protein
MHEVQDAVMGAAKAVLFEHRVGAAGEIPIGEEQQLDASNEVGLGIVLRLRARCSVGG